MNKMTKRLTPTAALSALVVCAGMTGHAQSLENLSLGVGRQFDLTAQSDKGTVNANMDVAGSLKAGEELKLSAPSRRGAQARSIEDYGPRHSKRPLGNRIAGALALGTAFSIFGVCGIPFGLVAAGLVAGVLFVLGASIVFAGG